MEMIMAFLVANSGVLTVLGLIIFGGVVALISKDRQKVYTKIYSLIVEAEKLELSNDDKFEYVLAKAYSVLPLFIKTFVSEDNVRRAIVYSVTKAKEFTALKMGVTPEVVEDSVVKDSSEVEKIVKEAEKIESEGKVEVEKLVSDIGNVIEKVSPKELFKTLSSKEVIDGIASGENIEKVAEDVTSELPVEEKVAINEVAKDAKVIGETATEVQTDVASDSEIDPVVEKVEKEAEVIAEPIIEEAQTVENKIENKVEEVKADTITEISKAEDVIIPEITKIEEIPVVAEILPIAKEIVPEVEKVVEEKVAEVIPQVNVNDVIAQMKDLILKLENSQTPTV